MKKILAPLCHSCAQLLLDSGMVVSEVSEIDHDETCAWCCRNPAESIYEVSPGKN